MKRIVLITSLCMFAGFSFAQKKAVKDAKSETKTEEARNLIKPALTNPETAEDPETWMVAGNIEYKVFDQQREAEMLKEMNKGMGANEEIMYGALYDMVKYYNKADELGQIPDNKGRIRNKFRKDIIKKYRDGFPYYINGGSYYNDKAIAANQGEDTKAAKEHYVQAANFFEMYWNMPSLDMFKDEQEPLLSVDSLTQANFQAFKYYSVICATQSSDTKRSIELLKKIMASPYIETDTYVESDPYELLAAEYQLTNDSINYVNTLKEGAEKFPKNQYFTPHLINEYIKAEQVDEAMSYLNKAILNDPSSTCELLSVKASLQLTDKSYETSIKNYKEALAFDENCEKALEGLGVIYILQAQELKETTVQITNRQKLQEIDDSTIALYQKSLPLLEKYVGLLRAREAENKDLRSGLIKLQNIYYNLSLLNVNKDAELQAVEKELDF